MKTKLKPLVFILAVLAGGAGVPSFGADAVVPDLKQVSQGVGGTLAGKTKARWETGVKGKDACRGRRELHRRHNRV